MRKINKSARFRLFFAEKDVFLHQIAKCYGFQNHRQDSAGRLRHRAV